MMMKFLLSSFCLISILSCGQNRLDDDFQISFDLREISFDGNVEKFNPIKRIVIKPNSVDIIELPFGSDKILGARYILTKDLGGDDKTLFHNAIFYEWVEDNWRPITEVNHREPAKVNQSKNWRIVTTVDGNERFMIDFDYLLSEQ